MKLYTFDVKHDQLFHYLRTMCSLSVCENRDIFQIGKNKTSLQVEVVGDCKNHSVMALTGKKTDGSLQSCVSFLINYECIAKFYILFQIMTQLQK